AAMGAGRRLGAGSWAGALLVTLAVGSLIPAAPPGPFLVQDKFECLFTNGTEPFRYLQRYIYNRQQIAHYDSELGRFEADTELGRASAEHWNSQPAFLAQKRAEMDTFCRYSVRSPRAAKPKVKVSPTMSGSQTHPHLLVCSVTGFYPGAIEIKWFRNGQEQMAGVVSTELLQDGDWTYQILVMLEMSPQRGDVYACQVEHISLGEPLTVRWGKSSECGASSEPPGTPCALGRLSIPLCRDPILGVPPASAGHMLGVGDRMDHSVIGWSVHSLSSRWHQPLSADRMLC
uniref:Ig-like domain-containing protein n=1 Tax=Pelusios castaneus TaxID=367368 RepID=A0A8C8SM21_9SAUR